MATEYNKHKITESSTGLTLSEIKDGVDFPHTGLIKALNQTAKGNHVVKTGDGNTDDDFAITRVNSTTITVKGGSYLRDNKLYTITNSDASPAVTLTLGFVSAANAYHLLVITEAGQFAIRSPAAVDKVADTVIHDVIVAVLTYTGAGTDIKIQYVTNDKASNSLSLAHNNGGSGTSAAYTQMGTIEASSGGITIEQDSATNAGHIYIKNLDQDRDIIFSLDDGGVTKTITFNADIATAQFADFSITTNGSITANGVTLTGGGVVANHGADRLITSGAANTDLTAESNLTFNGSTNTLAVTGAITGTTLTTTGLITTSANNISATAGSVSGVSIGAGTSGISNLGPKSKSMALAADAFGGSYTPQNTTMHANIVTALATPLTLLKEHYLVGIDSSPLITASSHANGTVYSMAVARTNDLLTMMARNDQNRVAGNTTAATYATMEVFGGYAGFIALPDPKDHEGKRVTITNISSFGLYVCVTDVGLDPSVQGRKNRMNGGYQPTVNSTAADKALNAMTTLAGLSGLNTFGNTRCVDLSTILLAGATPAAILASLVHTGGTSMDACLIKPRESVTFVGYSQPAQEIGSEFRDDVAYQQGLFHQQQTAPETGSLGQWFIEGSSSGGGFSNVAKIVNEHLHIPIHLSGTSFYCNGTNTLTLPSSPPIGTQYAVMSVGGTTTVECAIATQLSSAGSTLGGVDSMYALDGSALATTTVTATNGKTFIYIADRTWEIIG